METEDGKKKEREKERKRARECERERNRGRAGERPLKLECAYLYFLTYSLYFVFSMQIIFRHSYVYYFFLLSAKRIDSSSYPCWVENKNPIHKRCDEKTERTYRYCAPCKKQMIMDEIVTRTKKKWKHHVRFDHTDHPPRAIHIIHTHTHNHMHTHTYTHAHTHAHVHAHTHSHTHTHTRTRTSRTHAHTHMHVHT